MTRLIPLLLFIGLLWGQKKEIDNFKTKDILIETGLLVQDAGEEMMLFTNEYYKSLLIGFGGYLIIDYGMKNPISTSSNGDESVNPLVLAGSGIMLLSSVKQIFNYRKLNSAGKKLNKAGELLQSN